jgi:DNA-directed RNA polymerase delta subunit
MKNNNNTTKYEQLAEQAVGSVANARSREIISLRYGIKDGQRRTLEEIGQQYSITRERVRQVIENALVDLRTPESLNPFKPVFRTIDNFLNKQGNLAREEKLLSELTGCGHPHPSRGALFFILNLNKGYQRFVESENFYPVWTNSAESIKKAAAAIENLANNLENKKQPVDFGYISAFIKKNSGVSEKAVISYLDANKQIGQNVFGQFGLSRWPEINPRGVKDKAYIIFKDQQKPLHFREVADLINQAKISANLAQAQTVHNELIKDERFILVGRGTYALKEWGFQPGTVKEVIVQVLEENGPMTKNDVLRKVLEKRFVKENTILINLQNRKYFVKNSDNKYILASSH